MVYYSVRHKARIKARERRLRLRMAARSGSALCLLSMYAYVVIAWPNI